MHSPNICSLPENDWCHTTVRIERTKIHKLLKDGEIFKPAKKKKSGDEN